jgi:hypothetical protein
MAHLGILGAMLHSMSISLLPNNSHKRINRIRVASMTFVFIFYKYFCQLINFKDTSQKGSWSLSIAYGE